MIGQQKTSGLEEMVDSQVDKYQQNFYIVQSILFAGFLVFCPNLYKH